MTTIAMLNTVLLLVCFRAIMFLLVWWQRRKGDTIEDFTVANRNIGLGAGLGAYFYFLNSNPYYNLIGILTTFTVSTLTCILFSLINKKGFESASLSEKVQYLTKEISI